MDFQKMSDKALQLTKDEQELLTKRLIASLKSPPAEEIRIDAIIEAERRAKALGSEALQPIPEEDIMRDMQEVRESLQ